MAATTHAVVPSRRTETEMPRVSLDQVAPDFSLPDFSGTPVNLSDCRGRKNVLLIFNRTFR
jgi:peroxiredoxin